MTGLGGKAILVTGGTGSFGKRLIQGILKQAREDAAAQPKRVIVFSRDELKQFEMQQDPVFQHACLRFFLGDVRDSARLTTAFKNVDYVVHAAALKQVSAAEYNPTEFIRTNIQGAENVIRAAIENNVEKVVALSTDKAVNPVNLYGATKLVSEKLFLAANSLVGDGRTRFSVVRYGNVAGSRGSVLPFFKSQIQLGITELPVTDPQMTRFWLSLGRAVEFTLEALACMVGAEIFIPELPSFKIMDLVEALGATPRIVGIRQGEKIHETLIAKEEVPQAFRSSFGWVVTSNPHYPLYFKPIKNNREYDSLNNPDYLTVADLRSWIRAEEAANF